MSVTHLSSIRELIRASLHISAERSGGWLHPPRMAGLSPQEFVSRWRGVTLKECSVSHSHFIDLCRLLDQPTPTEADPTGDFYIFERGAEKTAGPTGGDHGWADVWKRGHFAWEYKRLKANLEKAYQQLQQYRESLENPPR